jgi:hypothetical protein
VRSAKRNCLQGAAELLTPANHAKDTGTTEDENHDCDTQDEGRAKTETAISVSPSFDQRDAAAGGGDDDFLSDSFSLPGEDAASTAQATETSLPEKL